MDLFAVLRAAGDIIKQVNHYSASIEDAEKVFRSFQSKLASTHKLLTRLEALVKEDYGDAYESIPSSSSQETMAGSKRDRSILRLIEDEGELEQLLKGLEEISEWLKTLGSESNSRSNFKPSPVQRRLEKEQVKKIMTFSSEMEKFKATATLVLTMALRYDRLLVVQIAMYVNSLILARTARNKNDVKEVRST